MSSELSAYDRRVVDRILAKRSNPRPQPPEPPLHPRGNGQQIDIERIVSEGSVDGNTFYDATKDSTGKYIGLPIALEQALAHAGVDGIVATMPEFISAKVLAPKTHNFWKQWYSVHTEENIGIDRNGKHYDRNTPVYVLVNGGGILTPERIKQAYTQPQGLIDHSAKYTDPEFDQLLEGKLPDGSSIPLFKFEDIKSGMTNRPHRFGIVVPYANVQGTKSDYQNKAEFLANPLAIARGAGDIETLEKYFDLAKVTSTAGKVGNWHPFLGREATVPQGRLLFVYIDHSGLSGYYLVNDGRFVAVAPEAQGARK